MLAYGYTANRKKKMINMVAQVNFHSSHTTFFALFFYYAGCRNYNIISCVYNFGAILKFEIQKMCLATGKSFGIFRILLRKKCFGYFVCWLILKGSS